MLISINYKLFYCAWGVGYRCLRGIVVNRVFDSINAIRALAVMLVFLLHASLFDGINYPAGKIFFDYPWAFVFKTPAWAGCWILFVVSGYLAGIGFRSGRYRLNLGPDGILAYYKKKAINVWLPTICFILFISVLCYPDFFLKYPQLLVLLVTCTYRGQYGVPGIGATWFVFTLMWLYLLTPLLALILGRIVKKGNYNKKCFILILVISIIGLAARTFILKFNYDWYTYVYTFPLMNIDLYFCGIILAYLRANKCIRFLNINFLRILSIIVFFAFIIFT